MAKPRHEKMYANSPELKRDEESGKMKAHKSEGKIHSEASRNADGTDGMPVHEGLPPHVRHAHERRDMHNRHETEHAVHDNHHGASKKEMHGRHQKEMADMHKRHEKEHQELSGGTSRSGESMESKGSGDGKEKIEKVEKD